MTIDLIKAEQFVFPYYEEPHRFYHTNVHIKDMLSTAIKYGIVLSEIEVLAIIFHDIVYFAGADTGINEEQSVRMLDLFCMLNPDDVDEQSQIIAGAIILDTVDHIADNPKSETVLDLDLHGLSLPWEEYIENGGLIRAEFIMFPDDQFYPGRIKFLENMLARERIYHTDLFHEKCEENARKNMTAEINILKNENNG